MNSASAGQRTSSMRLGSYVFHPGHGVAEVAAIESREMGEQHLSFYVLELCGGGRILLPTDSEKVSALRALISASRAKKLMKRVTTEPEADDSPWRERTVLYAESLRNGDADSYTEVLRQLLFRSRSNKLNMTERRLLETARSFFVLEVGIALGRTAETINAQLRAVTVGTKAETLANAE